MINITKDLKNTLQGNPHISAVYFDKFGNYYLHAHVHKKTKKLYHRIKDQKVTVITEVNGKSVQKKDEMYEVNPDHELIEQLSSIEALAKPVMDTPEFSDINTAEVFEKQAQESAKLKAEIESLKAGQPNIEDLKAEIENLKKEKAEMEEKHIADAIQREEDEKKVLAEKS